MNKIKKILWFNWKDRKNPLSGGAEIVNEELARRLVECGYKVIFLVSGFSGGAKKEIVNGYKIIRLGNRWTVYWQAYKYYKKNLGGWSDLIIDEMNTIPFFCKFYVKEKNIMFIHQLCRQIWFHQIFFPLSFIGYLFEPIYLWLLRDRKVITISESTKKDLIKYGFDKENISLISEGFEIKPIEKLENIQKYNQPTILSLGKIRSMKRTDHIIKAFEIARDKIRDLKLLLAGDASDRYGRQVLGMINRSPYKSSIKYFGKVSREIKIELMQKSHFICLASIKEGWGLVVSEANSQGTPAVVYNVDGLRDSVQDEMTGLICQKNTPKELAKNIINLLNNKDKYQFFLKNAWQWSREINFKRSYEDFISVLEKI